MRGSSSWIPLEDRAIVGSRVSPSLPSPAHRSSLCLYVDLNGAGQASPPTVSLREAHKKKHSRRLVLCRPNPSHFRICMPDEFFCRHARQCRVYDLSIMMLRARVNALTPTRCNFAAYIIRISESVAELIGPTARLRQERMLKP